MLLSCTAIELMNRAFPPFLSNFLLIFTSQISFYPYSIEHQIQDGIIYKKSREVILLGRFLKNNEWIIKQNNKKCDDATKLFECYLRETLSLRDAVENFNLLNTFYKMEGKRFYLNSDVRAIICKTFIYQLVKLGNVKPSTYLLYLNLILIKETLNKYEGGQPVTNYRPLKGSTLSKNMLKTFIAHIKKFIIEFGPGLAIKGIQVRSLLTTLDPMADRYSISLDITTTNLYELCKRVHNVNRCSYPFPFKSPQSLGQIIRYHKDSFIRQGVKVRTYKKGSKHVIIEYYLNAEETEQFINNERRKGWY